MDSTRGIESSESTGGDSYESPLIETKEMISRQCD
jgi:hypothetical protein